MLCSLVPKPAYEAVSIRTSFVFLLPALLLPPDRPKAECEAHLRQAGLALLSIHFADPPEEDEEGAEQRNPREEFGGAYMELRGKRKARFARLSTGPAMVEARTDCWLTYDDFMKLTA